MSSNFKLSAIKLVVFGVLLYVVNLFLAPPEIIAPKFLAISHVFFLLVTIGLIYLFDWVSRNYLDRAGYLFIAFLFIKILAIFVFLTIMSSFYILHKWLMLNFSLLYLSYLFFSIYLCLKTLKVYQK